MDPNQTWSDLSQAVQKNDWEHATELAEILADWIGKGGLPPTITGNPAFDRVIARATAQSIATWETA